jgi:hypothetical protein
MRFVNQLLSNRSLACNPLFLNHVFFGCVSCYGDGISIFDHLFLRVDPVNMATVTERMYSPKEVHTHIARRCKKVRYSAGVWDWDSCVDVLLLLSPIQSVHEKILIIVCFSLSNIFMFLGAVKLYHDFMYIYIHIQCTCTYSLIYVFLLCKCICILICTIFSHKT